MPLAFIHLPATPRHQVHVGKVFVREEAHQKHVWRPRGHPGPKIWDLSDPAQIADFNAAVSAVCVKQPGVHQIPVPFVFEAPAATPVAPPQNPLRTPTHRCKICGALWILYPDWPDARGSWSLASQESGPCCNNVPMGDQIEPLAGSEQPPQPPAAKPEKPAWFLGVTLDKKGYVLSRPSGPDSFVFRGIEDIWSPVMPSDPFTNKKAARKAVPKGIKLIEPTPE